MGAGPALVETVGVVLRVELDEELDVTAPPGTHWEYLQRLMWAKGLYG